MANMDDERYGAYQENILTFWRGRRRSGFRSGHLQKPY